MKLLIVVIFLLQCQSTFALQCESIFSSNNKTEINRPLLNSLKRIRNFGVFSNIVMTNPKSDRMTLVVFDIFDDGTMGKRKSIDDHVRELRSFASEMRYVYNPYLKDQILLTRITKIPESLRHRNLLFSESGLNLGSEKTILDNLRKSNSLEESYNYEVVQTVISWLSKPGAKLNVLVLPEGQKNSFIEKIAEHGGFRFHTMEEIIQKIDPNSI